MEANKSGDLSSLLHDSNIHINQDKEQVCPGELGLCMYQLNIASMLYGTSMTSEQLLGWLARNYNTTKRLYDTHICEYRKICKEER